MGYREWEIIGHLSIWLGRFEEASLALERSIRGINKDPFRNDETARHTRRTEHLLKLLHTAPPTAISQLNDWALGTIRHLRIELAEESPFREHLADWQEHADWAWFAYRPPRWSKAPVDKDLAPYAKDWMLERKGALEAVGVAVKIVDTIEGLGISFLRAKREMTILIWSKGSVETDFVDHDHIDRDDPVFDPPVYEFIRKKKRLGEYIRERILVVYGLDLARSSSPV